MNEDLIYGRDKTQRVVSIEPRGNLLTVYSLDEAGELQIEERDHYGWALAPEQLSSQWEQLEGNNHFKWQRRYSSHQRMKADMDSTKWCAWDVKEAALIAHGITYFKGMKLEEVPILAFDIEATGLHHGPESKVLLISNTFKKGAHTERKLFAYDEYPDAASMFDAWTRWVRTRDPSIITGHNIYGYDLPYLEYCARMAGTQLELGRDGSPLWISDYDSKFRRDGSQFYNYNNAFIAGREIVDTMFLSYKYDVGRKYTSYGLKNIIAQEGLEITGRVHYDAALIARNHQDPIEWQKIKAYAEHDADDAMSLFTLMVPAFFYLAQSVPKTLQQIVNGATGSQINSLLVRGYLQAGHSVPKASEPEEYEGAISIGNPGVYRKVFKVDVASLYPSIILEYGIQDSSKDPLGYFQGMMKHFTAQRLEHKKLGKKDRYFKDLSESEKIVINSGYGFLGAPGLSFNSPQQAALVTAKGRDILNAAIEWVTRKEMELVNADTDSVAFSDCASEWTQDRKEWALTALNELVPAGIRWEDDGVYDSVIVLKAKNYIMRAPGGKLTVKGAALKASLKEPALREFIDRLLGLFLDGKEADTRALYHEYVKEICNLTDIKRWAFKRTITETLYHSSRANETKVVDALGDSDNQLGDKVYLFYDTDDKLVLVDKWNGNHSRARLLKKLYMTAQIFSPIYPTKQLPNYTLKRTQLALNDYLLSI